MAILLTVPVSAQWSADGVIPIDRAVTQGYDCCPDGQGGAWWAQNFWSMSNRHIHLQHIDSDGYLSFDSLGVDVVNASGCQLIGIEPGLDGDVVVMFTRSYQEGDIYFSQVFAQRLTLNSVDQRVERLWGDLGINISNNDFNVKYPYNYDGYSTVSDGAGGLWGLWQNSSNVYVSGVNADGSLKHEAGVDPQLDYDSNIDEDIHIVEDGAGGLTMMFASDADGRVSDRHFYAVNILADGSFRYDERQLVLNWPENDIAGYYTKPYHLRRDPQGGYVITTAYWWQRISDDLVPQWADQGVRAYDWDPPNYNLDEKSNPVILADRSILQLCTTQPYEQAYLEQVLEDGTRRFGTDWGPVAGDSTLDQFLPGPDFLAPDSESVICIYNGYLSWPAGFRTMIQRLTPDGTNLWSHIVQIGTNTITLRPTYWTVFYIDDYNICYFCVHAGAPDDEFKFYAFKLNVEDGTLAGVNSVSEPTDGDPSSPSAPALISNAYPNPFNSSVALTISVQAPGIYDLVVHNVLGQTIHREAVDIHAPGEFVQTLTLPEGSASGIYFLTLQLTDGRHLSQKKVAYLR
ncbi:T9SS type A sorting domain-containing protein [bacterium]|nr:T9SS type A sorting domain-containing protein [bacterium]